MKITINLNYQKQLMFSVTGNMHPAIENSKKVVNFKVEETKSDFDFPENEKKVVQDKLCEFLVNEGYKYYYTEDKKNVISRCPFRDKIINGEIVDNNGEITILLENGGILKFVEN